MRSKGIGTAVIVGIVIGIIVVGVFGFYFLMRGETKSTITSADVNATRDNNNIHFYAIATIHSAEKSIIYVTALGVYFETKNAVMDLDLKVGDFAEVPPNSEVVIEFEGTLGKEHVEDWGLSPGTYTVKLVAYARSAPTPPISGVSVRSFVTTVLIP